MPQIVEVTVGVDGSVTVEAKGVVGSGCKALTAAIEKAIGTVTEDVKKPEFHRTASQTAGTKASAGL
jgi:hypothetical protein